MWASVLSTDSSPEVPAALHKRVPSNAHLPFRALSDALVAYGYFQPLAPREVVKREDLSPS